MVLLPFFEPRPQLAVAARLAGDPALGCLAGGFELFLRRSAVEQPFEEVGAQAVGEVAVLDPGEEGAGGPDGLVDLLAVAVQEGEQVLGAVDQEAEPLPGPA